MSKNYDLYPKSERKIDNWRRRILGYEKMKRYLQRQIQILKKKNKQLKERIEYLERSNNRREDTILEQRQKISDLEDNWNKLKESIDIKLYNIEYLQKLCGCRLDDEIHMILDILKKTMQELEENKNE